ncbi:Bgt-1615 [Blumeria graminis f. sp. tritici]|uniref:Bgt-1615 n=2 Tax=Blumeria graminis f. sp. tritici TaxID=62690 RepID=A0A381LKC7_BLUGR|nr:hypothetical protein BGT96224_1615 [Blumeria graminis f. sp. tritici 96224]VDB92797.1 Bgt-1615 [Blumeria graminis f. sp. tritici]
MNDPMTDESPPTRTKKESRPSTNGTLTLRRSYTNSSNQPSETGDLQTQPPAETTIAQQITHDNPNEYRYTKQNLLDIYRRQQESGPANGGNVSHLYADGWAPGENNGSSNRSAWGKASDVRDCHVPDLCWDSSGDTHPVGLEEMSEQEKALFNGDINSSLKPLIQTSKDPTSAGHKPTFSHGQGPGNFSHSSSTSNRASTRRQLITESAVTGISSPNGSSRFSREDNPHYHGRRIDHKDNFEERSEETRLNIPLNGPSRNNSSANMLGPGSSTWSSSINTTSSPMGAFGNFAISNPASSPVPADKRSTSTRVESRFFQTTSKENIEEPIKPAERSWRPRQRTDTDPFAGDIQSGNQGPTGDNSAQAHQKTHGLDTPARGSSGDFGMSGILGFGDTFHRELNQNTPKAANEQTEPLSPSDTNPFCSPPGPPVEIHHSNDKYNMEDQTQIGISENGQGNFVNMPRGFSGAALEGSDRSQTSSVAGSRILPQLSGLPSLGTIGGMSGWPGVNSSNISDRENRSNFPSAFGNSLFGSIGEIDSGVGLSNMFSSAGTGSNPSPAGRGSKLGTLFPAAMQAQMQNTEIDNSTDHEVRHVNSLGVIARNAFPLPRDNENSIRSNKHVFENLLSQSENTRSTSANLTPEGSHIQSLSSFSNSALPTYQQSQASSDSTTNQQLPNSQQRMMVMPDRMRWVYLDPQAQVQGPFSGLEMHDWYKASFFTPDLSVKKLEDADFEPLGQLIRRIGNSREPFLVPQIGIPHGQPSTQPGAAFTPPASGHGTGPSQTGSVQPPFASSFPSFGTTLTAEQQNNLERRKQEEQYLMARQREFLVQQQVSMKQMQMGGIPSALHHHSSVHNLQSQSNFGNISSPIGMPPQPPLSSGPGFFDGISRPINSNIVPGEFYRDEDLLRLSTRDRHALSNAPPTVGPSQSAHVTTMFGQSEAQNKTPMIEDIDFSARISEFEKFKELREKEESAQIQSTLPISNDPDSNTQILQSKKPYNEPSLLYPEVNSEFQTSESVSITQKSQTTASMKKSPTLTIQPNSPWVNFNVNSSVPFQQPIKNTSPTASSQKCDSNQTEKQTSESTSPSRTPEATISTPSIAPWAKEPGEIPKAFSLRAISEAEEKKAAEAEELANAARRASCEQELKLIAAQQLTAPTPGLPTTSTWGSVTAGNATPTKSVWAKPAAANSQASANKQKTLADIQREEELRKQKLAAASAVQSPISTHGGKRYAELASKTTPSSNPTGGPAWFTVGAGGKVKVPVGPSSSTASSAVRTASSQSQALPVRLNTKPATPTRNSTTPGYNNANNVNVAREELAKWTKATLEKGLNPGINVNDFAVMLSSFPSEPSIIADSIYSQSQTMNGNDFAVEFIRRRNNAEKGIIEPSNSGPGTAFNSSDKSGGWSEVAKKGPPKEEPTSGFKLVPNKKKGKK